MAVALVPKKQGLAGIPRRGGDPWEPEGRSPEGSGGVWGGEAPPALGVQGAVAPWWGFGGEAPGNFLMVYGAKIATFYAAAASAPAASSSGRSGCTAGPTAPPLSQFLSMMMLQMCGAILCA